MQHRNIMFQLLVLHSSSFRRCTSIACLTALVCRWSKKKMQWEQNLVDPFLSLRCGEQNVMEVCCDHPTAPGRAVPPTQPFLCFLRTDTLLGEREQDKAAGFKKEWGSYLQRFTTDWMLTHEMAAKEILSLQKGCYIS